MVPPPATELARIQGRFDTLCAAALALPGVSLNSSSLEACVAAIRSRGCSVLNETSGPCSFDTGSLATGGTCITDAQCQSGDCSTASAAACGACAPTVPNGSSCANGQPCEPGAICTGNEPAPQICTPITYGAEGVDCFVGTVQCSVGLTCNSITGQCSAPGAAGTPCNEDRDCASPLACPAITGPTACQVPGGAGSGCSADMDCADGLGCDVTTSMCGAVTFASAGQPCSDAARCLVGPCQFISGTTGGTCPTVTPDGQPCSDADQAATCDTFAQCENGTCVLGYPSCP